MVLLSSFSTTTTTTNHTGSEGSGFWKSKLAGVWLGDETSLLEICGDSWITACSHWCDSGGDIGLSRFNVLPSGRSAAKGSASSVSDLKENISSQISLKMNSLVYYLMRIMQEIINQFKIEFIKRKKKLVKLISFPSLKKHTCILKSTDTFTSGARCTVQRKCLTLLYHL